MSTADELGRLRKLPPLDRYRAASEAIEAHRRAMADIARVRAEAIRELQKAGGWGGMTRLAEELGVSRQALYQAMQGRA